jgi:hypothetical protein
VIDDSVAIPGMVPEGQLVEQVMVAAAGSAPSVTGAVTGETSTVPVEPPPRIERGKERPSGLFIP